MIIALALIHHVVISGGIPLKKALRWLTKITKTGIIEFVTKDDLMVKKLLSNRRDHFDDYNPEAFLSYLGEFAKITTKKTIKNGTRLLVSFKN